MAKEYENAEKYLSGIKCPVHNICRPVSFEIIGDHFKMIADPCCEKYVETLHNIIFDKLASE